MKRLFFLIPLFVLASCGGGDSSDDPKPTDKPSTPTNTQNTNQNDASQNEYLARLEMPHTKSGSTVVTHTVDGFGVNYSFEWDSNLRAQRWTCYTLTKQNMATNGNSRQSLWGGEDPWEFDPDIAKAQQQQLTNELSKSYYPGTKDYYEKGHICPSADRLYSKDVNRQTFYMTNILPMVHNFNGGIWNMMEARTRNWANSADELYVCKGGTIDKADQILGKTINSHIVPKYFFTALLHKKGDTYKALAFWVEHLNENHESDPLGNYVVSIDELETKTGIDFFCNLPDAVEMDVEATVDLDFWNLTKKN